MLQIWFKLLTKLIRAYMDEKWKLQSNLCKRVVFVSWVRREKDAIISVPEELRHHYSKGSYCAEDKQFCKEYCT